jgi:hypothetical protein
VPRGVRTRRRAGKRHAVGGGWGSLARATRRSPLAGHRVPFHLEALLSAALAVAPVSLPQGPVVDEGSFSISHGGVEVGRESYTIRRGSAAAPDGFTITTSASYPATGPRVILSPVVELGPDSLPRQMQFDVFGGGKRRIYLQFGPHRVTLRDVHPGGESARELPRASREILVDDSVFALYALLPRRTGHLAALAARTGDRSATEIVDRGEQHTTLQGVDLTLRHIVLLVGDQPRDLWYDAQGRLMRVDIPAAGLVAERLSAPP